MKITFLGTGTSQGIPVIGCKCLICRSTDIRDNRLRSSVLIETETKKIVIDTGPDFRQQMLREQVEQVDAILFTHEHKDHTAGFDDIRPFNFFLKRKMDVYSSLRVQEALRREFSYIFKGPAYPGIPEVNLHLIDNEPFFIDEIRVVPIEVMHHRLPVQGFRIGDFSYITDANFISDEEMEKLRGSKVLVLNALRKEEHLSHFTLDKAVSLALELGAEKTYFTHISHQLGLHAEVQQELPKNIFLAEDGLQLFVH